MTVIPTFTDVAADAARNWIARMGIRIASIIVLCAVCLGGQAAHGATFGYTTVGSFTKNIEGVVYMSRSNLGSDGVADSITAYIGNTFGAKNVRFLLYRKNSIATTSDSVLLVAWTDIQSVAVSTGWVSLPLNPKPLLYAGDYYIGLWSASGAGVCNAYFNGGTSAAWMQRSLTFDSTATYNVTSFTGNTDSSFTAYVTYTASTDGVMGDTLLLLSGLSCEGTMNGGVWQTPAKDIVIDSAAWWIDLASHSATSHFRAMGAGLYLEADSSLLDYSDSISVQLNGNGDRFRVFHFNNNPTISASTNIFPSIWSDTSYATIQTRSATGTGGGVYTRSYSWKNNGPGTWPDPMGAAKVANWRLGCLLYYHDAPAGGIPPRRRKIILGQPLGLVTEATETFAGSDEQIPK